MDATTASGLRLAVVPRSVSTFVFHPKSYAKSDYAVVDFADKCLHLAREAVNRRAWPAKPSDADGGWLIGRLLGAWESYLQAKRRGGRKKARRPLGVFNRGMACAHCPGASVAPIGNIAARVIQRAAPGHCASPQHNGMTRLT